MVIVLMLDTFLRDYISRLNTWRLLFLKMHSLCSFVKLVLVVDYTFDALPSLQSFINYLIFNMLITFQLLMHT